MIVGLDMNTGARLDGLEHLKASVRDILTTPIGSRVMRRDYGSRLFELIDATLTPITIIRIYAAVAEALRKWEPRLRLTRVQAEATPSDISQGKVTIDLEGEYLPEGRPFRLEGLIL